MNMRTSLMARWMIAAVALPLLALTLHLHWSDLDDSSSSITKNASSLPSTQDRRDWIHATLWLLTCETQAEKKPWFLDSAMEATKDIKIPVEMQIKNVCENMRWNGFKTKYIAMRAFLEKLLNNKTQNNHYIVFVDSDVVMNSFIKNVAQEIVQRYHEIVDPAGHSVVIGAEPGCWIGRDCQTEDFDWVYPGVNRTSCPAFVNSGLYMGELSSVFQMIDTFTNGQRDAKYEDLLQNYTFEQAKEDDQAMLGVWYAAHKDVAILDTQASIFRNLFFGVVNSSKEGIWSCGKDAVKSCGANVPPISGQMNSTTFEFVMDPVPGCPSHPRPMFLHGNGPAKAICRDVYDQYQEAFEKKVNANRIPFFRKNPKRDEPDVLWIVTCETRKGDPWFFDAAQLVNQKQLKASVRMKIEVANLCDHGGKKIQWEGWMTKLLAMKKFVTKLDEPPRVNTYITYLDSDVLMNSFVPNAAREIVRRFHEIIDPGNHSIVFGATPACSIGRDCLVEDFEWLYPGVKRTSCASFLDSGFYMGSGRSIRRMISTVTQIVGESKFEEMFKRLPTEDILSNDQGLLSAWYVSHKDMAVLDTKGSLFRNLLVGLVNASKHDDEKRKWSCGEDGVLACGSMEPPVLGEVSSKSLEIVMDPVPGCPMEPKPMFLHATGASQEIHVQRIRDAHNKAVEVEM